MLQYSYQDSTEIVASILASTVDYPGWFEGSSPTLALTYSPRRNGFKVKEPLTA